MCHHPAVGDGSSDLVGDHERGVESNTKLSNDGRCRGRRIGIASLKASQELFRPGSGDRSQVCNQLLARHPDTRVGDRQRAFDLIARDHDLQRSVEFRFATRRQPCQTKLLQGIARVRYKLTKEHFLRTPRYVTPRTDGDTCKPCQCTASSQRYPKAAGSPLGTTGFPWFPSRRVRVPVVPARHQ